MASMMAKSEVPMAAENDPNNSAEAKIVAPSTAGATISKVTLPMVPNLPAPRTCALSSCAGSMDFMAAEIITKKTLPSNSAITQAMPSGELMLNSGWVAPAHTRVD